MQRLVTVVIPTYNYAHKVIKAIASVASQTMGDFECFIVDDGSTDDTETVVKEYIQDILNGDARFSYIKQPNSGVAVARNRGISNGDCPFVCCLDADDSIDKDFLYVCVGALLQDPLLGIAYTGIHLLAGDGRSQVGQWPGEFDYDQQLKGLNQIPTCCVFRREIWLRTGGYRPRYCPKGAGSEDANLWLRAGAIGFSARRVTEAPFFTYSYKTGYVSGNAQYSEINWRAMHPWTFDHIHPFASVATPAKLSHAVYQYDSPLVAVIIPVSKNHRGDVLFDAIESVESQGDRRWEIIVVDDSGETGAMSAYGNDHIQEAYPFVKWISTGGNKGSGYARNRGAEAAKAPFLLFLDADDVLMPEALEEFLIGWQIEEGVVYSDYIAKAYITLEDSKRMKEKDKMIYYDKDSGIALLKQYASEYDCDRAVRQPDNPPFIWNLVSSLVPRAWHNEIGGFDESMESWEDWDYWIRMARTGKCFTYVQKHLVMYRFYTGTRREVGIQEHKKLIKYLLDKYSGVKNMACNCGGKKNKSAVQQSVPPQPQQGAKSMQQSNPDDDFVKCVYKSLNRGEHAVHGPATKRFYGHRPGGSVFYVHKSDIAAMPDMFEPIIETPTAPPVAPVAPPPPPTPPVEPPKPPSRAATVTKASVERAQPAARRSQSYYTENDDVALTPGVSPAIAAQLNQLGVFKVQDIHEKLTYEDLIKLDGVAEQRAKTMLDFSKKYAALKAQKPEETPEEDGSKSDDPVDPVVSDVETV